MRLNRWVMLISLIAGVAGIWFVVSAFDDYLTATRSFTQVEVTYVDDSFVWLDPNYEQGQADITITNNAGRAMTIEYLNLSLAFDGEFAGAWYDRWEPMEIPAGESITVTAVYTVTQNSIQSQGGDANLTTRGRMRLAFDEIEEPLTINIRREFGQVSWNEQS